MVQLRLHTKNHLPVLPGSALKLMCVGWWWVPVNYVITPTSCWVGVGLWLLRIRSAQIYTEHLDIIKCFLRFFFWNWVSLDPSPLTGQFSDFGSPKPKFLTFWHWQWHECSDTKKPRINFHLYLSNAWIHFIINHPIWLIDRIVFYCKENKKLFPQ